MVAIAILGLTLTVVLSAQGGLAASNRSAANMGQAAHLGRCKMTETEERLLKLGYQEIDQIDTDTVCCENGTPEGFSCDIKVEKVVLPNFNPSGNDAGALGGILGAGSGTPGSPPLDLTGDGGLQSLGSTLQGQLGAGLPGAPGGGAGAEGMLNMVMGIIYPSIKPMYEASIRRVSVMVKWKEGPNQRELPLVQFVTNPQRGGFAGSALLPDGGAMDFAAPATSGAAPTGTGTAPGGGGTTSGGGGGGGRP
jgi:general secretion pathway protein I